jgi:type II secretory pathway pseudopilin PulG
VAWPPRAAGLGGFGLGRLPTSADQRWSQALTAANQATQLAQTATSSQDWLRVSEHWGKSLVLLSQIPEQDQRSVFSQRRTQEYLRYLQAAQQRARQQGFPRVFPALGSTILDEQLSTYYSYVAALGPPDILIVGSSRALQGIDPRSLRAGPGGPGSSWPRVYNFGVNGATAQVVSFLMRQLLGPDPLPRMVIWAEGVPGV